MPAFVEARTNQTSTIQADIWLHFPSEYMMKESHFGHIPATHGRRQVHYMHQIHNQGQQRLCAKYYQQYVLYTSSEKKQN